MTNDNFGTFDSRTDLALKDAKEQCIREAEKISAANGWIMSYCGLARSWNECFSYLDCKDGRTMVVFQYNVGKETKATMRYTDKEKRYA